MPGDWLKNCIRWKKNQYNFCLHLCLENLLGFYHNHHRTVILKLAIWPHTFFVKRDQENCPGCKFKQLLVLQLVSAGQHTLECTQPDDLLALLQRFNYQKLPKGDWRTWVFLFPPWLILLGALQGFSLEIV